MSKQDKPGHKAPSGSNIPERCSRCAHWLGRYSEDPQDERCNRNYGHEKAHGDFRSEESNNSWDQPAFVTKDCTVPRWGDPIPPMDEHGNPVGKATTPKMVDAFVPARTPAVQVVEKTDFYLVTESQIQQQPEMSDNPFLDVADSRKEVEEKNQQAHEDRHGSSGEVGRASDLPSWMRGEEKVPTGIVQLDWALDGGVPKGTMMKHWGPNESWKTTLVSTIAGAHQQYRDRKIKENFEFLAERWGFEAREEVLEKMIGSQRILGLVGEDYDPDYASKQGLDPDRTDIVRMDYLEESLQYIVENIKEDLNRIKTHFDPDLKSWWRAINYPYIWVDSWDAFKVWQDDHGANDSEGMLTDNSQMGARASLLSDFWKLASNLTLVPVTMNPVAQQRIQMNMGQGWASGDKGNADKHNTRIEFRHSTSNPDVEKGQQIITMTAYQTQCPGGSNIYTRESIELVGSLDRGLEKDVNLVKAACDAGVINKSSWLTYVDEDGEKLSQQGTDFKQYATTLKEEGLYDEVYQQTLEQYDGI